jgi:quercetin dioxygenase-like cupin family protein
MHPKGAELVACVEGTITLHQEIDGEVHLAKLAAGQAIINPPGVWHTADVDGQASALFVTAGVGTEIRPR